MTASVCRTLAVVLGSALLTLPASGMAADMEFGTTVPAGAKAGDLTLAPCEVYLKGDDRSYPGDCGTLVVPENRRKPGSRLIALPVTRVKSTGAAPLEPVFWLQGGPGGPNVSSYPTDGLPERHDFVMVGYRGIDGQVALKCPEVSDAIRAVKGGYLSDRALASYGRATAECAQRIKAEGVDLDGYSMNQTIDDMEAARNALGYQRINLLGESYGTRVATLYLWRYPDSIRRVVMVGVNPPGHFVYYPQVVESQLGQYAALCAKDAYCSSRTPDLLATLKHVSRNMPTHWLGIPIDPDLVRFLTFLSLMESIPLPGLMPIPADGPAAIDMWLDAAEGDASGMALMSLFGRSVLPFFGQRGHTFAMGLSAPDYLGPNRDFRAEMMPPDAILGSPFSLFVSGMVPGWPATSDQSTGEVQDSAVETLLVSGSIDFSTPMEGARDELLPHLSNGHQVILRDLGHCGTIWNSQPQARARLLNTFFDTGVVDASLYRYQAPKFEVEKSFGGTAKMLLGAAVLALGLLILLIVVIVVIGRKLRRRWAAQRVVAA